MKMRWVVDAWPLQLACTLHNSPLSLELCMTSGKKSKVVPTCMWRPRKGPVGPALAAKAEGGRPSVSSPTRHRPRTSQWAEQCRAGGWEQAGKGWVPKLKSICSAKSGGLQGESLHTFPPSHRGTGNHSRYDFKWLSNFPQKKFWE